jgi:hypothetical protein
MKAWVLFKEWCGKEQYWTGEVKPSGEPAVSWRIHKALTFDTAGMAYEVAHNHSHRADDLRYPWQQRCPRLGRFRVGLREIVYPDSEEAA